MSPYVVIALLAGYFGVLLLISHFTGEDSNDAFFIGKRSSPWYVVAFGMIGASLSGVTFISVPGWVGDSQFSYMQMVLGYLPGYLVVALVLMPLYYRLNLTSIYTYLRDRFGQNAYKAGASFFLLSRVVGASFRLYLVAIVLQYAVFEKMGFDVPFVVPVIITILLIWLYTRKGGIKTIIWTDTLQTTFMLLAVIVSIAMIARYFGDGFGDLTNRIVESDYSQIFFFELNDSRNFFKNFLGGAFITIVMTGLDQDMMQKNLSCKNIGEAKKNMLWFSVTLVFVNLLFLSLGALLFMYAGEKGITIPQQADELFPMIAMDGYLGYAVALFFILGLIAAAYSSADSALTALTTSFCVDILDIEKYEKPKRNAIRKKVHIGVSVVLVIVIVAFRAINNESVISELFTAAGFTYGPLLGLYAFGLFSKWHIKDRWVWPVLIAAPILSYVVKANAKEWFNGYEVGFEVVIINGLLTFIGLMLIKSVKKN
ncbi:sodium:solute symporter [Salibacter halophilus]|uniref:Sodium:solute symporter n=1 Tax=Salibacter halophilus TaxID=1803916 RepID=A0A6N6M961_9FLAO|nr:sodium:solute symporter [Salibacter halophilus]KAB1064742.1 sodium:solute symporter [Salibacter halophilus]